MVRAGNATESTRTQDIKAKIQSWLMGEGWRITQETAPDAAWLISADDEAGRRVLAGQKSNRPELIVIQAAISVGEGHQRQLAQLDAQDRRDFLWDMRFALLESGVDFSGLSEPLERIQVTQRIYQDGLTQDSFLQRVSQVRNGLLTVLWMIARKFAEPPPPQEAIGFRPPRSG